MDRKAWCRSNRTRDIPAVPRPNKDIAGFQSPSSLLASRTITWVAIGSGKLPICSIGRRERTKTAAPYAPLEGAGSVLKILEQDYIQTRRPAGNKRGECVRFAPGGSITSSKTGGPHWYWTRARRCSIRRNASGSNMCGCRQADVTNFAPSPRLRIDGFHPLRQRQCAAWTCR